MDNSSKDKTSSGETDERDIVSKISASDDTVYLEVFSGGHPLLTNQDASDLVVLCLENSVNRILIHDGVLSERFFSLRSGMAGIFLQKFENYSITAAIVIGSNAVSGSAFLDMAAESNRGEQIRFFEDAEAAREWISDGPGISF